MTATTSPLKVGMALFPGFELLDVFGPLEMFSILKERATITLFAGQAGEVASIAGPRVVAEKALAEADDLDVLLVPGGMGTRREVENTVLLDLLRRAGEKSRLVASICTGSALLARAGMLDGRRATSNKLAFDWVRSQGPQVSWVRKARWVEDGKFFTSSGVSAGMDMTLGMIARELGHETSLAVARQAEYLWQEDATQDPFA